MLSRDFNIVDLCMAMGISRAGFYKWKNRKPSSRDLTRDQIIKLVEEVHKAHSTHGYRWTAAYIRINHKVSICDSYAYKCFRYLGIKSETLHKVKYRPRKVKDKYPNLIYSTWDTVDRPRQVIVSDMTALKSSWYYFELTMYFDVFTKEIVAWRMAKARGAREQYVDGLADVVDLLKGQSEPTILHTDQGSVYSSIAYNDLIKDTNIIRSMSRAGKPTDNPVNESLNGWIKEELVVDFNLSAYHTWQEVNDIIEKYVKYYNEQRPCFAIGYDTPHNYRERYYKGELETHNSFEKRVMDPTPKSVRKKLAEQKANINK